MAGPYTLAIDIPKTVTLGTAGNCSEFDFPLNARSFEMYFKNNNGRSYPTGTEGAAINANYQPVPANNWVGCNPVPGTRGISPNTDATTRKVFLAADVDSTVVTVTARAV